MELSNEFEVGVPVDQAWSLLTDLERIAPCLPGAQLQEIEGDEYRGIVKIKVGPITAQYKGLAKFVSKDDEKHKAVLTASGRDTRGQGNASAAITAELTSNGDDVTHVSVLTDLTITGKVAQFGRGVIGDVSQKLLTQFVQNLESMILAQDDDTRGPVDAVDVDESEAPAADTTDPADDGASESQETTHLLASELAQVMNDKPEGSDPVRAERPTLAPRPDLLVAEQHLVDVETEAPVAPAAGSEAADKVAADKTNENEGSAPAGVRRIDAPEAQAIDLLDAAGTSVFKRALPLVGALVLILVVLGVLRRRRRQ